MSEAITEAAPRPVARSRDRFLSVLGLAALVAASVGLFIVSRGKWSDAIIDSGREWIVPDALARGELLYRDVVYWFGPFTPYLHSVFFRLFGSGFGTLVIAGLFGSSAILAALWFALRRVTGRWESALWTVLAIPALLFLPNGGGSILGMGYRIWHASAFALVALAVASKPDAKRPRLAAAGAGALAGLAGLCRTEWGFAALAAVWLGIAFRKRMGRDSLMEAASASGAFLLVFGGVLGGFIAAAGSSAVIGDGHVLLTGLPRETRAFALAFSGLPDWKSGAAQALYSTAMWLGVYFVIEIFAVGLRDTHRLRRVFPRFAVLFAVLGACALAGGASGAVLFSAGPLLSAAALAVAIAWRGTPFSAATGSFGLLGVVLSYRRPFHIGDSGYVGPPLLFALVSAAALTTLMRSREIDPGVRARLRDGLLVGLVVLTMFAFVGRTLQYRSDPRIPVPGTDAMLTARPEVVSELTNLTRRIVRKTSPNSGLVVFPEGEVLNLLARRRNPIRYKLYIPGYLTDENEPAILAALSLARPSAIVIWSRPTGEYGRGSFGVDYGKKISAWIAKDFETQGRETGRRSRSSVLAIRKAAS